MLRLPNLLTVPGDPLAGFLLASVAAGGRGVGLSIIPAAFAAVGLYAAGLVANDLFDLPVDRRRRPDRPLPSGRITPVAAAVALAVLTPLGVGLAFLASTATGIVAIALAGSVFLYDGVTNRLRLPGVGAVNMGVCRGLSLLLGAAAAGGLWALPAVASAVGVAAYIAAVTWLAAGETRPGNVGIKRLAPLVVLAGWLGFVLVPSSSAGRIESIKQALPAIPAICALLPTAWVALRLGRRPAPAAVQRSVGLLIGTLLPIQATLCATASTAGLIAAAALLAAFPLFRALSRRFYAS